MSDLKLYSWDDVPCGRVHVIAKSVADARLIVLELWGAAFTRDGDTFVLDYDRVPNDCYAIVNHEPMVLDIAAGIVIDCYGSA